MTIEAIVSESIASPSPRSDNPCATRTRRLESFQQMMLRWEQIRPYNAVHAVELSGLSLTADRVSKSVNAVLRSVGVSDAVFDTALKTVTYGSLQRFVPVSEVVLPQLDWTAVSDLMTAKLTESYQGNEDISPFRILLVHSSDGRQYLIIGYRHAIADAHSLVLLLNAILENCLQKTTSNVLPTCEATGLSQMFQRETGWPTAIARVRKLSVELAQGLLCKRPKARTQELTIETCSIHQATLRVTQLKAAAKRYRASVQDFMMAAQVEAIAEVFNESPDRRLKPNQLLAVNSMIDLRRYADGRIDNTIGQFLGMLAVRPAARTAANFSSLVDFVKHRNERSKHRREFFWLINSMSLMARLWDLAPLSINRDFARKLYPFVCALSNVHLAAPVSGFISAGVITNYFRGANLGVLVPLVLSNTTVGDTFNLCTTHKASVYSVEEVN